MISSRQICVLRKLFRSFDKRLLTTSLNWEKSVDRATNGYTSNFRTRLLNYLELPREFDDNEPASVAEQEHRLPSSSTSRTSLQNYCNANLSKTVATELEALVESIKELPQCSLRDSSLAQIDKDCCKLLRKLSHSQVLHLLCVLAKYHPSPVTYLKFYKVSLQNLRDMLELHKLSIREMLQLLFMEGLIKKSGSHKVKYTITFLPPLRYLTLMEQCIVALVAFKCAVKLEDIQSIYETVEYNAEMLVNDPAILVTFCKALRLSGLPSDCSFRNLSATIVNNTSTFSIKGAAHVLCLYAEAKVDNPGVLRQLFNYSMEDLAENAGRQSVGVIIKDVNLLLWASSTLNYNLRSSDASTIISFINRRYYSLSADPIKFANILLCLWIMNCRLKDVMVKCLKDRVFVPIVKEEQVLWKPRTRLQLLLSCTRIEAPEVELPDEIIQPHKVGLKISKSLVRLSRLIEALKEQLEIDEVNIDCPVDCIYIPGVTLKLKKGISVHVDLLDQTVCLRHTTIPFGLLNLKLRLLPKIGIRSLVITEAEITNAEAASSIESCIKNIVQ